ncbi:hypothetical protein BM1_06034 [Bipolaris maydis]|nr:hypothetical protein BM1_06034 [Bipolaris maydis]
MGISLKIKIPVGSRRRPSKTSTGQKPPGEGSSRKHANDHRGGGPQSPCPSHKPEPRPRLCIAQPTPYNYNTVERRPSTVLLDPHVATHTITTPTPSSHRHRRRSSISIHSPPRSSHGYVETRRHRRRSSQTSTPRSPVSPLGTSHFEYPSPWSRPRLTIQRDEYGFSIRTPSTPAGQANE